MSKEVTNYTEAQEALIASMAPMDYTKAQELASDERMNDADGNARKARSIVAKAISMGVEYNRKVATTKSGEPVVRKAELVEQIARTVEGNLDGLEKAPKAALVALRDALAA